MTFGPPPSPFTQSQQVASKYRKRRRLIRTILIASLVLALGVGTWFAWPDSNEGKPGGYAGAGASSQASDEIRESVEALPPGTPRAGHMLADMQTNAVQDGKTEDTRGLWVTKKVMAKAKGDSLYGMKASDPSAQPEVLWRTVFSGGLCGETRHVTVDGRTALLSSDPESGNSCALLTMVDLDTGKRLWHARVPWKENPITDGTAVTMTRGMVVTSWGVGAAGYDMRTGKKLWQLEGAKGCWFDGFAGGGALLEVNVCDSTGTGDGTRYQIKALDPRTGKTRWSYRVADGVDLVKVVSSSPAVIAVGAGEAEITDLISLGSQGKYRATVRLEGGHYQMKCSDDTVEECWNVVVGKDQVFISSGELLEELDDKTNWVVGFDLATGRSGAKFDAGHDQKIYPLRMSGDRLLGLKTGTDDAAPMSLVSMNPKTREESPYFYFSLPQGGQNFAYGEGQSEIEVENGRVYFGVDSVTGEGNKAGPTFVRMAFGIGPAN